jgi:hypothetical protein
LVPRRRRWRIVASILLVLFVGLGGLVAYGYIDYRLDERTRPSHAKPGDCLHWDDPSHEHMRTTDCDNPDAELQVAYRRSGAGTHCIGGYAGLRLTDGILCAELHVGPGQCVDTNDGIKKQFVVPCAPGASGIYRVEKVVPGTSDPAQCSNFNPVLRGKRPSGYPYIYEQPPKVICFEPWSAAGYS